MSDQIPEMLDTGKASIARAAPLLRRGGLVAVPTETVYGLAADATDGTPWRASSPPRGGPGSIR
jgi:L-threonylcarbamoyladenylate synthase